MFFSRRLANSLLNSLIEKNVYVSSYLYLETFSCIYLQEIIYLVK